MDINNCKLQNISNKKYFSELIRIPLSHLKNVRKYYTTVPFTQMTQKNKPRTLYNPSTEHKRILKSINRHLQKIIIPEYVIGGVKGKSYINNGEIHNGQSFFCLIDFTDFFPSTNEKYVYNFFRYKLNNSVDIAKILTLLVTETSPSTGVDILPQGYPTSPILSYLSYHGMFSKLKILADANNYKFSCYYDDVTFSSNTFINKNFKKQVIRVTSDYGLKVHPQKSGIYILKNGIRITGTIVRKEGLYAPNKLQLKMINQFKELEQKAKVSADHDEIISLINRVQGTVSAIKSIEKDRSFPHITRRLKEIRHSSKINNIAK
ncbi:reverse transcriptase family protein [Paenibacillus faecalis]|uniref:reverse transcriptase family protein n=1 Tax=Paenibacillus faecalis TaxID=2079532 RepID=UPI000D104465|nr:reverse transcriptase family protein [Paenibacillus faecalis]